MRQNIPEIDEILCESDLSHFKLGLKEDVLYKEQQQFLEQQDMKSTRTGKVSAYRLRKCCPLSVSAWDLSGLAL